MKHHRHLSLATILVASFVFIISCQEPSELALLEADAIQEEFDRAIQEVNTFMEEETKDLPEGARYEARKNVAITLLRFRNGQLEYNTWDDDIKGYVEVTEEEITATVQPGCYVFTFRGAGLRALNAIEFDEPSRQILGDNNTYSIIRNYLWLTRVPSNVSSTVQLKYDIVYDARNDGAGPIRLDPKIVVN